MILIVEGIARCVLYEATPSAITSVRTLLIALIMGSVWVFWIGPLRSDPFRQVIRSPFHAARMFCLYVVVLPVVVVTVLADAINLLLLS